MKEIRDRIKAAKRKLSAGDAVGAEHYLLGALEITSYLPEGLDRQKNAGFINHRLAEVSILLGEPMTARRRFKLAVELIESVDNKMAHARVLRDYGNFRRLQSDKVRGRQLVEKAIDIFESIEPRNKRVEIEQIVTETFLARFDLTRHDNRRNEAIETLRIADITLRGYKKRAYELANLSYLIESLPAHSLERIGYIHRAVVLSARLGNYRKVGEYLSLIGGKPSRLIYKFIV